MPLAMPRRQPSRTCSACAYIRLAASPAPAAEWSDASWHAARACVYVCMGVTVRACV